MMSATVADLQDARDDSYLRKLIRVSMLRVGVEIRSADIPAELIEAKRAVVRIRRICRGLSK